jgi:hypothetical protein
MYSDEQSFIWDIDELTATMAQPLEPSLVGVSGTLRRLLIDNRPLVHRIARVTGIKPMYKVNGIGSPDHAERVLKLIQVELMYKKLSPFPIDEEKRDYRELHLDDFLKETALILRNEIVTIKQIVQYTAHVGGGVHKGRPRKEDNAPFIHETARHVIMGEYPYPVALLFEIVEIVVDALTPLKLALQK